MLTRFIGFCLLASRLDRSIETRSSLIRLLLFGLSPMSR
jgi:hypothetical protein